MPRPALRLAAPAALLLAGAATSSAAEPFTVVAMGDVPYGEPAEVYPPFESLLGAIQAAAPALVLHVGDTKSGGTPCSDAYLDEQLAYMEGLDAPVLYTPGDNEWTDCHREPAGGFDPLDRLARIRETYFGDPARLLGAAAPPVETQAAGGYPENQRLVLNEVMFLTVHVVGSNNNFEVRDRAAVDEFFARDEAGVAWLREGFAAAGDARAVVVAIHADMFEFDWNTPTNADWLRHSGFANFGPALAEEAAAFGRPVLLVYGDSHQFEQSRPFPVAAPNLMALQVPGDQEMHAVEVTVDPDTSGVFSVSLLRNPALTN